MTATHTVTVTAGLESLIMTRSQKKAIAHAVALRAAGNLESLRESGNKADLAISQELHLQSVRAKARKNNNAIRAMVVNRYGSDDLVKSVAVPADSKTATLLVWVASMGLAIRGKDDSTQKAIQSRHDCIHARFGDIFALIGELSEVAAIDAPTETQKETA